MFPALEKGTRQPKEGTRLHPRQGVMRTAARQSDRAPTTRTPKSSLLPAGHTQTAFPHRFPRGIPRPPGPPSLLLKCIYTLDVSRGAVHTLCATSWRKPGQSIVLGSGVHGEGRFQGAAQGKARKKGRGPMAFCGTPPCVVRHRGNAADLG